MITINEENEVVTLTNVFTCEPSAQQALIDAWIEATGNSLGKLPGIISASLHRSKDGTRVVNHAQWKSSEAWENLEQTGTPRWFREMAKYAQPDAHLYEVCYVLDETDAADGQTAEAIYNQSPPLVTDNAT